MDETNNCVEMVLDENDMFTMDSEEFSNLFPAKWRKHKEVQLLYKTICERHDDNRQHVQERIEEFLKESTKESKDDATCDNVLESMEELRKNLTEDIESVNKEIDSLHGLALDYITYLKDNADEILNEVVDKREITSEQSELESFLNEMSYGG